jgi:4-alpha-glucanotransferase
MKKCGILMPVFSLPSKYGIGSFGKEAYRFVDFLVEANQNYWQVLPLNPTTYGDSPYQSPSAFAGNPYFIDLDILKSDGLLTDEECTEQITNSSSTINYDALYKKRYSVLRKAFSRFIKDKSYYCFLDNNSEWLTQYSEFMSHKLLNDGKAWNEWTEFEKRQEEVSFWCFLQYEFFKQWKELKCYANNKGVEIIGDLPIYVAYDSADVFNNHKYFQLDKCGNPTSVAGVPPDEYCDDGQLWGNPLYNWALMQEEKFAWWIKRFNAAFELYNIVRIDHFRGFAGYYSIPYGEETARNGKWFEAPGKELFRTIKEHFPNAKIIAEDLGFLDESVTDLLNETGFPGMKIAQFGFYESNSIYNPKNYINNCVAYTGTHDNPTTIEWLKSITKKDKRFFRKCVNKKLLENDCDALIRSLFQSNADTVIIPIQDYLHLDKDSRINTPSTLGNNWCWVLSEDYAKYSRKIKSFKNPNGNNREKY